MFDAQASQTDRVREPGVDGGGGRDVGVRPVIDVQERPLRPLEQDFFPVRQRSIDRRRRVSYRCEERLGGGEQVIGKC